MQDTTPLNLSDYRSSAQSHTHLKHLCTSGHLFRERYRIVRVLGRGGFGITYLAQDMLLPGSQLCVIKQLSPKAKSPLSLERAKVRFKREARILATLGSHSQVPMLLDYFTVKGEFFLVQEYVQGETLNRELRRSGSLSEGQVKAFLRDILSVLKYVHRHRVIHRDIKPPNIIRCRDDGRLVLIDFGAVRETIQSADESMYRAPTTQFIGTMGFAPPEQLALRPTFASDIYALGVTCIYLLTGKTPIELDTDTKTGELLWQPWVTVSPHFDSILTKMLKPSVAERYQTVDDVERALDLEPYYSNLADCMNTPSRPNSLADVRNDIASQTSGHLSPIQREAAAIRRWRSRRTAQNHNTLRTGLNSPDTVYSV